MKTPNSSRKKLSQLQPSSMKAGVKTGTERNPAGGDLELPTDLRPREFHAGPLMRFISRLSSFLASAKFGFFTSVFSLVYRRSIRKGGHWLEPLKQEVRPRPGERILELSAEGCSVSLEFAQQHSAAHFYAVHGAGLNENARERLHNFELLKGDQYRIDCRAATFDKVICTFALHPLPHYEKLAVLREMKRVLRHGGTLHLADFDQPQKRFEIYMLRGTGYLFGDETANSHNDGTWVNLIQQAGLNGVRRIKTYSEIIGRVAIVRARRA